MKIKTRKRTDSFSQVCIGLIATPVEDGSGKILEKLVVIFEAQLAAGAKRQLTVTMISFEDKVYKGSVITGDDLAPLKIVNVDDQKDILFDGTIEPLVGREGIELVGKYFNPLVDHKPQPIRAALEGSNIPPLGNKQNQAKNEKAIKS
jgi:hypothetical protein